MDYMLGPPPPGMVIIVCFFIFNHLSKMAILALCKNSITIEATSRLFFVHVLFHFRIPQTIISKMDKSYLNTFWSNLRSPMDKNFTKSKAFHL